MTAYCVVTVYLLGIASGISLWHFAGPRICVALRLHVITCFRNPFRNRRA